MKKKVKGIYEDEVVKLLESIEAKEGEEVEVLFSEDTAQKSLTKNQKKILKETKGKWADDPEIDKAFKILEEGWKQWQIANS